MALDRLRMAFGRTAFDSGSIQVACSLHLLENGLQEDDLPALPC